MAISPPAQLTRAGFYRLEASYDPALFAKENGIDLGELQVEALRLQTPPLDFEISESLPPSR